MEYYKYPERYWAHFASAPIIYGLGVFIVGFDLVVEIYHRTCFKLYGLPYVNRSKYIRFDRYELEYLTLHEKINCTYCSYVNGLMAYASRIFGDTEKYWCAIKHEEMKSAYKFEHQKDFLAYGDKEAFEKKYKSK
jgi:hypothetical protein